jgi:high-affinity iron transporter
MLATLVIFLREGVEASMIVAILLAYLARAGQRRYFRYVFAGVAAALGLAGIGGLVAYLTIKSYAGSRAQTIFETCTYLLAAAILTYMTFWMRSHARGLKGELQSKAGAVLADRPGEELSRGARAGLGLLSFQAVGREGVETVVFTLAIAFSSSHKAGLLAGAAIGLAISMAIAFTMYRLGHRMNIGRFFTVVGALLMVFAAGLLVDAVQNLQELGWLPLATHPLWHTGAILREDSAVGDIAHSFFGYAQSPTALQALVYLLYLGCVLLAYFGIVRRPVRRVG